MSVFTNPAGAAKEAGAAYTAALLELLGDADPLTVLDALPGALDALLAGAPAEALRVPERPGKWSAGQVLWHLADSEMITRYRMRRVVAQQDAIIGYDQDAWADGLRYEDADPAEALALIRALRPLTMRWLRGLSAEEWERAGVHSERGRETVRHIARLMAGHDLLHRRQLARVLEAVGARPAAPPPRA